MSTEQKNMQFMQTLDNLGPSSRWTRSRPSTASSAVLKPVRGSDPTAAAGMNRSRS